MGPIEQNCVHWSELYWVFWLRDLARDSIHHDSPKAFPYNVILLSSRTSKMGFLSANGLPREYHGQYTDHEALYIARVKFHYTREGCRKNGYC